MLRIFVLSAILTFALVEPHFRRHCHNHPPFHGNPCPGVVDTDQNTQQETGRGFLPHYHHRRHCHNHPPFYGNPCPGVVDTDQKTQPESGRGFLPHSCHKRRCGFWHTTTVRPSTETELQTIERELKEIEEKFVEFCKKNSPSNTREMYGTDNYFLIYDLPDAKNSNVTVQIKHKFIHTTVTKKDGAHEKVFEDVKVVPDIANARSAMWMRLNNKELKITIPYKVPLGTEVARDCGAVNNDVIDVLDPVAEIVLRSQEPEAQ